MDRICVFCVTWIGRQILYDCATLPPGKYIYTRRLGKKITKKVSCWLMNIYIYIYTYTWRYMYMCIYVYIHIYMKTYLLKKTQYKCIYFSIFLWRRRTKVKMGKHHSGDIGEYKRSSLKRILFFLYFLQYNILLHLLFFLTWKTSNSENYLVSKYK